MADDLSSRLNALLSDPSAMQQIMSLASGMMGSGRQPEQDRDSRDQELPQARDQDAEPVFKSPDQQRSDNDAIPAGLSFSTLQSRGKDANCELLCALKPFLRKSRADKIDMMIRVMQISRIARKR